MNKDVLDNIEKLSELKNKGILTEEEFQNKKTSLLEETRPYSESTNTETKVILKEGSYWLPIPSIVLGIISCLAFLDSVDSLKSPDVITGLVIFTVAGLILGIVSISTQSKGKGMAIAGIILSSIALLMLIGLLS